MVCREPAGHGGGAEGSAGSSGAAPQGRCGGEDRETVIAVTGRGRGGPARPGGGGAQPGSTGGSCAAGGEAWINNNGGGGGAAAVAVSDVPPAPLAFRPFSC